jgi:hypothetical protein
MKSPNYTIIKNGKIKSLALIKAAENNETKMNEISGENWLRKNGRFYPKNFLTFQVFPMSHPALLWPGLSS